MWNLPWVFPMWYNSYLSNLDFEVSTGPSSLFAGKVSAKDTYIAGPRHGLPITDTYIAGVKETVSP